MTEMRVLKCNIMLCERATLSSSLGSTETCTSYVVCGRGAFLTLFQRHHLGLES